MCENCCLLRVGTGNVELAALFAPKPLGMTVANDWTREMMTKGFPELQRLYSLLGVKDRVLCKPLVHFPHNYNYVTRANRAADCRITAPTGSAGSSSKGGSDSRDRADIRSWPAAPRGPAWV